MPLNHYKLNQYELEKINNLYLLDEAIATATLVGTHPL
jgi:hypothetical protein